jgi:hypothetical protein
MWLSRGDFFPPRTWSITMRLGFSWVFYINLNLYSYIYIWVDYKISLTWNKAIWGWFPLLTMIPVRSLPRYMYIYWLFICWRALGQDQIANSYQIVYCCAHSYQPLHPPQCRRRTDLIHPAHVAHCAANDVLWRDVLCNETGIWALRNLGFLWVDHL